MALHKSSVKTCATLLQEYQSKKPTIQNPVKLSFSGVGDKDVYNITAPFQIDGVTVIAGRVESRDSEHSEIRFFVEQDGIWIPKKAPLSLHFRIRSLPSFMANWFWVALKSSLTPRWSMR